MANEQFVVVSNELEDFGEGGGLYPGGTGVITAFEYGFWDYNGKMPPNSMVAVKCVFHPTDGSNDSKDESIYWNVGHSKDFQPSQDGGFLFGASGPAKTSCNWGFVLDKFRNTCGLEAGKLSQPGVGIKALVGTEVTLARVDQPTREGLEPAAPTPAGPGGQGQRKFKPTILIPTRCVFPWDKGGAAKPKVTAPKASAAPKPGPVAVPSASAPAPTPVAQAAAAVAAPAPSSNGHGDATALLTNALMEVLVETGGTLPLTDIPMKAVTSKIGPALTIPDRMALISKIKSDPAYLAGIAQANGWNWDGATLSV